MGFLLKKTSSFDLVSSHLLHLQQLDLGIAFKIVFNGAVVRCDDCMVMHKVPADEVLLR